MKRHDVSTPGPDTRYPDERKTVILWLPNNVWIKGYFLAGNWYAQLEMLTPHVVAWSDPTEPDHVAQSIHYPECWDTAAYPTFESALAEVYAHFACTNHRADHVATPGNMVPTGWQPIETAPKDGTEIWAFNGEQARMKWIEGLDLEYQQWIWADELLSDANPDPDQPTHWRPKPPDPGESPAPAVDHSALLRMAGEALDHLVAIFDHPTRSVTYKDADRARSTIAAIRAATGGV